MNDPAPGEPARPLVSVVDAVCCVYFCAAGKSTLLIDTLTKLGMEILIPAEVEEEVLHKHRAGRLATHWPRMRASRFVRILEKLEFDGPNPEVVAHVARIRGREATLALSVAKDLGEAVVLGHAAYLAEQGAEVYVVIDDIGGQRLAYGENVQLLTVEDLLLAAVQLHLLPGNQLRTTYDAMLPFGSGLPTWEASALKPAYQQWKRDPRQP